MFLVATSLIISTDEIGERQPYTQTHLGNLGEASMTQRGVLGDLVGFPNERLEIRLCVGEAGIQIFIVVIRVGEGILFDFSLLPCLFLLWLLLIASFFDITSPTRGMMRKPIVFVVFAASMLLLPPTLDRQQLLDGAFLFFELSPDLRDLLFLEMVDLAKLIVEMLDKGSFVGIVPAGRVCFLEFFLQRASA